jgi:hypothetical protein
MSPRSGAKVLRMAAHQTQFIFPLTAQRVDAACGPSPWDFGNRVLYEMIRENPSHVNLQVVIGKLWIVGRAYAAAIERRKTVGDDSDPRFYESTVAREILASDIDEWIAEARSADAESEEGWKTMVQVHQETTSLFNTISGHDNRSLASKYLHFHVPKLFYLFDRRAREGLTALGRTVVGRASKKVGFGDYEYRKHAERCRNVRRYCEKQFHVRLEPRHLDNLLLAVAEWRSRANP